MVDGKLHHFSVGGLYNGLILFIDDETRSYWDHITGECVVGDLRGRRMPSWGIEITTVEAALKREPSLPVLVSKPPLVGRFMALVEPLMEGKFPPGFRKTMGEPDARLLGIARSGGNVIHCKQAKNIFNNTTPLIKHTLW